MRRQKLSTADYSSEGSTTGVNKPQGRENSKTERVSWVVPHLLFTLFTPPSQWGAHWEWKHERKERAKSSLQQILGSASSDVAVTPVSGLQETLPVGPPPGIARIVTDLGCPKDRNNAACCAQCSEQLVWPNCFLFYWFWYWQLCVNNSSCRARANGYK